MTLRSFLTIAPLFVFTAAFGWNTPNQSSPGSGSIAWTGVTVNWAPVASSQAYQLQVDTSVTFNSPLLYAVTKAYINSTDGNADTREALSGLRFGTTYRWRVRAYVSGDTSAWSPSWTFSTRDEVYQSSPATGSFTWTGTTVNWGVHDGVTFYDAQLDTTTGFSSPASLNVSNAYINSTDGNADTRWDLNNLYFGTTYHWRVRCRNNVDTSAWSPVWTFTTRDDVSQSSPTTGSITWTGTTVNWGVHNGVTFYDAQLDTTPTFTSPVLLGASNPYINSTDGNADTRWDLNNLYFGTTYHWRVRCRNNVDTSAWSPVWTFTTRDDVSQSSPTTGSITWTGTSVNWGVHNGVTFYDAQLDTTPTFTSPVLLGASNPYINSTDGNADTRWDLNNLYFGTTYHWRVRCRNNVDTSAWSPVWTFTTRDEVSQSSPTTGSIAWTGTSVNWGVHNGVTFYDAQLDTTPGFSSPVFLGVSNPYINSTDGNADTRWDLNNLYFGTTYHWRVRCRNNVDTSAWSPAWTFTTRDDVSLTSPADGQLNVSVAGVTLNWAPHVGVLLYQSQWDTTNLFTSGALQSVDDPYINGTDGNTDTQNPTGALLADQWYFWRVRAINGVDTCAWTVRAFSTGSTPIVLPVAPSLISPANAITLNTANVDLVWSAVPGVAGYEYMISTLPDLSNALPLLTGGTQINYGPMTVGTTYYWRVRSLQGGNTSPWSATWSFTFDPSTGLAEGPEFPFTTYPNPTDDVITIQWTNVGQVTLSLFDAQGRLVSVQRANGRTATMDLSGLPSGLYRLRCETPETVRTTTIVKK